MRKEIKYLLALILCVAFYVEGRCEIALPMRIPFVITANFGELRTNHFHTGLDMRAPINTPVYAVDSGYVSRISVSPGGYGNALYINHPSGITTVYGHLNSFSPEIEKALEEGQQKLGFYAVDLYFSPEDLPVKRGEQVARSGNRGSSGGPHLHFEIRDTKSERPLDPLKYYKNRLKDTRSPSIQSIAVIPYPDMAGESRLTPYTANASVGSGVKQVKDPVKAWGEIILGVKAYDYVTGMSNIYGVRSVKLYMDDDLIYHSQIDTLDFALGRMINTFVDYRDWMENRSFYMRSYVAPGNRLPFYKVAVNDGVVKIDEEREYKFRYELSDLYGNTETCCFTVIGNKSCATKEKSRQGMVGYDAPFEIKGEGFMFRVPAYAAYEDWAPSYEEKTGDRAGCYSPVYTVSPKYLPLDKACNISIKVDNDTLKQKTQYYIADATQRRGKISYSPLKTSYSNGWVSAKSANTGSYVVLRDSLPPVITPLAVSGGEVRFKVVDKDTGVKFFRGEIDGKFVIFQSDCKDNIARYRIDSTLFPRGKRHHVKFMAVDNCQNENRYESFIIF